MDYRADRRAFLAGTTAVALSLAGCPSGTDDGSTPDDGDGSTPTDDGATSTAGDATDAPDDGGLELGATEVATGLGSPVDVVAVDGDLLVAEQPGRVAHVRDGEVTTLLDLTDRVVDVSGYSERGLLGVEPHSEFAENGRLFVRYSAPPRAGTPDEYSHTFVLAEFSVDPDAMTADPETEQAVLEIPEPQGNHNAGPLAFGPDGLLYVPVGDGGAAGDQGQGHVEDWYDQVPGGNGQDTTENLLGSLLRIDVDGESDGRSYAIPSDNPLVGTEGRDEHYAWGLRNPWGMSVGPDGRLFVADVGQNRYEEVNVVERGGNYGWNVREGPACFETEECPTATPDGQPLQDPILSYGREGEVSGQAVIGGHLYDGAAIPALQGQYVFGDWQAQGRLFAARETDAGSWISRAVPLAADGPGEFLLTIGRDADDELLIGTVDTGSVTDDGGALHRLTTA